MEGSKTGQLHSDHALGPFNGHAADGAGLDSPPEEQADSLTGSRHGESAIDAGPRNALSHSTMPESGNHPRVDPGGSAQTAAATYPPLSPGSSVRNLNGAQESVFEPPRHPQLLPQLFSPPASTRSNLANHSVADPSWAMANRPTHSDLDPTTAGQTAPPPDHSPRNTLAHPSAGYSNSSDPPTSYGRHSVTDQAFRRQARKLQVFGTPQTGIIGRHKPREIIRIDRDYSSGEICQFWSGYQFELEGRITATQQLKVMNTLNAILASAFDPYKSIFDNVLAVLTLYLSTWILPSHYDREIRRFDAAIEDANRSVYNPAGLNLLNPRSNGYLFLELEYY